MMFDKITAILNIGDAAVSLRFDLNHFICARVP